MILNWTWDTNDSDIERLWDELTAWTAWAARTYPTLRASLKDCWPEHPEVIHELTALMCAWELVYIPPPKEPNHKAPPDNGFAALHWMVELRGVVERVREALKPCSDGSCWRQSEYGSYEGSSIAIRNHRHPAGFARLWEAPTNV